MSLFEPRNGLASGVWYRFWTALFNVANQGGKITAAGSVALVLGTKTVTTSRALTGSAYFLTRKITGGTPGHLDIGTIVNETSFAIVSDNPADTSTVSWMIVEPF